MGNSRNGFSPKGGVPAREDGGVSARIPILVEDVSFSYNGNIVLEDINLTISEREFAWIVGPNGGGKTTLMKILLGLLKPQKGTVTIFGKPPAAARRRIGYLPQHAQLDLRFPVTVMDIALTGRLSQGIRPGFYSPADRAAALAALDQVGLRTISERPLGQLSGGQQRRLLIARALACGPDLLLLDEPTANLDRQVERELYDLLQKLNERATVVMVSHDPAFVSAFVERVVCINRTLTIHPTAESESEFMGELYGSDMRVVRHGLHPDDPNC